MAQKRRQTITVKVSDIDDLVRGKIMLRSHKMIPFDAVFIGIRISEDGLAVELLYEYDMIDPTIQERLPDVIEAYITRL